ncbi:hypothetical protein BH11MYX1_BH11MYX1_20710 [soil metagenome]
MSSSGRRWAFLIGVIVAFAIPKRVACGYPGAACTRYETGRTCGSWELEPWGFYLVEYVVGRDVGFAYTSGDDCH